MKIVGSVSMPAGSGTRAISSQQNLHLVVNSTKSDELYVDAGGGRLGGMCFSEKTSLFTQRSSYRVTPSRFLRPPRPLSPPTSKDAETPQAKQQPISLGAILMKRENISPAMIAKWNSFHLGSCSLSLPYGHSYSFVSLSSEFTVS